MLRLIRRLTCIITLLFVSCALLTAQNPPRVVHVFVALADNENQGIVPVAAKLGNGDDPERNLYWGSAYGVKTFFAKSPDWQLVSTQKSPQPSVLERCIFKHRTHDVYLIADAYRGVEIRQATIKFLEAAGGIAPQKVQYRNASQQVTLNAGGASNLVVYIGHDGLMDFPLSPLLKKQNAAPNSVVILACASKQYFGPLLRDSGAYPLLWTTNLMAPEAYTLKAALDGWIGNESHSQIRDRAAEAYSHYQKCSLASAKRLLVTGW